MAGSKKWFIYSTDLNNDFAILLDESNTEAVNGELQDFLNDATVRYALPRNLRPRAVFYGNADKTRIVKCVCLTFGIYQGVLNGNVPTITDPIAGTGTLGLVRTSSEKIRLPFGVDTGLTDGDPT